MREISIGRRLRRIAALAALAVAGAVVLVPGASAAGGPLSASPDPFVVLTSPGVGTVHFTNTGAAAVQVTGVGIWAGPAVPSTEFLLQPVTSSCAAAPLLLTGMSCNVDFTLIPGAPDPSHAALIVESLSGPSFADLHFGGTPPPPPPPGGVLIAPSPLLFGAVEVGVPSAPQTATVTNGTAAPVALSPNASSGFSVVGGTCGPVLAPASSCTYDLVFVPTHPGPHVGFLDVMIDGGPMLAHADLAGDGAVLGTAASLAPASVVFPSTTVGATSAPLSTTLTNFGIHTLVWGGAPPTLGPDFLVTGGTCLSLPYLLAGGSCTMSFAFRPTASGTRNDVFPIPYNGPPVAVTLSGNGVFVLANAGSQGGGYVVQGGPNVEANRDRFEWALRTRADGSLYGKIVTYRFTEGGIRYVARVDVSAIAAGTFQVAGNEAVIEGAATLASVAGTTETRVSGSWTVRVQAYDLIAGSNNGAGVDRVYIRISNGGSTFRETGASAGGTAITSGAIGNAVPWTA
jgi:hypothetical protein